MLGEHSFSRLRHLHVEQEVNSSLAEGFQSSYDNFQQYVESQVLFFFACFFFLMIDLFSVS